MSHKHNKDHHKRKISKSREWLKTHKDSSHDSSGDGRPKLEFVLKCDSAGSVEAVTAALKVDSSEANISIIQSGVGNINHSDVLMAETGSRFIAGFQVDVLPGIETELNERNVETRLYNVIYKLTDDIRRIAGSLALSVSEEEITGSARVIALYKSIRKGVIIGCEVLEGSLSIGKHFRIISAMGPVYSGTIESMHIERDAVQKASPGQQVGIKIRAFNKAKVGDIVECFRPAPQKKVPVWHPKGEIIKIN